jgi:hypothetical protein
MKRYQFSVLSRAKLLGHRRIRHDRGGTEAEHEEHEPSLDLHGSLSSL